MIHIIAVASGLLLALAGQSETMRTRVPQANVDAFMAGCAKDTARATCWCVVEKMNGTADGQFVLDVVGLRMADPKAARPELLQAMNRHGLRHTQATAALKRTEAIAAAAAKECE